MGYVHRAKFKKGNFVEFLVPTRTTSRKVVIMCDGAPSVPSKLDMMEFWRKKGYWVFHVRYRGSWESDGSFLEHSPHEDLLNVIDQLPKGFIDEWSSEAFKVDSKTIYLIGMSFGGPAVLLASRDERVTKVIAVAPVVDWTKEGEGESFDDWRKFMSGVMGNVYRGKENDWKKLKAGAFYSPVREADTMDGSKILVMHAKDDDLVPWSSVKHFIDETKANKIVFANGGHLSQTVIAKPNVYKKISKFLKTK